MHYDVVDLVDSIMEKIKYKTTVTSLQHKLWYKHRVMLSDHRFNAAW